MVSFFLRPLIFVVFTFAVWTFTFRVAFFPLFKVTVIFAVPVLVPALIFPFLSTVTIFLLLEAQDFMESPYAMETFTFVVACFRRRVMEDTFSFIVAFNLLP